MINGRFAVVHVLEDVGDVAATVHHPALVQRLALPRGAHHQLQRCALLRVRGVD